MMRTRPPPVSPLLLGVALCAAAACSFRFDEDADEVELRGTTGPLDGAKVIHRGEYTREVSIVRGAGGAPYLIVQREQRAIPLLGPPGAVASMDGQLNAEDGRLYRFDGAEDPGTLTLVVKLLGDRGAGTRFQFPVWGQLTFGKDAFSLWSTVSGCVDLVRFLPDGSYRRRQLCGVSGGPVTFDPHGEVLISRDTQGRVYANHGEPPERILIGTCLSFVPPFTSTGWLFQCVGPDKLLALYDLRLRRRFDLGTYRDGALAGDVPARHLLLLCGTEGTRVVSYPDGASRRLSARPCDAVLGHSDDALLYRSTGDNILYQLPLDGSPGHPVLDPLGARVLAACDDQLAYAPFPQPTTSAAPGVASEGWLDATRFMGRGLDVSFGEGCRRLRWRDDTSYGDRLGTLLSLPLPLGSGRPLRLGIESSWYLELPDRRVVATANMDGDASLLLVDEERRQAVPLVTGAERLTTMVLPVPELNSVIVQGWVPPKDYTLYQLRLPPP